MDLNISTARTTDDVAMQTHSLAGIAMALAAAVLWGTTGTAQTFAPGNTSPYWVGALRLAVACAFFLTYGLWERRRSTGETSMDAPAWRWVLVAGACIAAYNLSFFSGVKATGVAVGTAVAIGSGPIWAGVLQALLLRRAPSPEWWLGTLLAVAGGAMMVAGDTASYVGDPVGLCLCLIAGFAYSSYTLVSQGLVRRYPPSLVTLRVFVVAACIAIPAAVALSGPYTSTLTGWVVVGYLGVVSTGLSYLLFGHALRHISGATGVTLALAEPVTAFLLAVFVVAERPTTAAYVGLGLVLTGLLLVVRTELRAARRHVATAQVPS